LSDEKENAYFADGVQDEILTGLAKVADLKVISRTSVMQYKSGIARNLREVAKELGVAHLLGGSVQRAGGRVRVSAQLVDARTDRQLWGQTYDRDLADVFAIQTDLAQKIATELRAKLSPSEKAQIERRPTENTEAYLAFMQGHEMFYRAEESSSNTEKAEQLFEKATNSIQTLPVRLLHWHGSTIGIITTSIQRLRARKKRVPQQTKRFVCNRTCLRPISQWVFIITIASAIIRQRSMNSPSRSRVYQTRRTFIWPSVRSSAAKANGRSPPRIWRERRL
jgi:TolB-like protein